VSYSTHQPPQESGTSPISKAEEKLGGKRITEAFRPGGSKESTGGTKVDTGKNDMSANSVSAAFDQLIIAINEKVDDLNQLGAHAFRNGDYAAVAWAEKKVRRAIAISEAISNQKREWVRLDREHEERDHRAENRAVETAGREDLPYSLKDDREKAARRATLQVAHIRPLTEYVEKLRKERGEGQLIPYFDPCDGGVNAKVLFLLEAPGGKAVESGFISRNNPEPAAKNMLTFLKEAVIPRHATVIWNIVPWYVGASDRIRAVNTADLAEALPYLPELFGILQHLKVVVLVGGITRRAEKELSRMISMPIITVCHPSQRYFNSLGKRREQIMTEVQNRFSEIALRIL
jgi:uracil-DNA glycosylase